MISGFIEPSLDPIVPLTIGNGIETRQIDSVLDTGFNDYLSLPADLIAELQLPQLDAVTVRMANGRETLTARFVVRVLWHNQETIVVAQEAEGNPLLGMSLLLDNRVCLDVQSNGAVTIEPLT